MLAKQNHKEAFAILDNAITLCRSTQYAYRYLSYPAHISLSSWTAYQVIVTYAMLSIAPLLNVQKLYAFADQESA